MLIPQALTTYANVLDAEALPQSQTRVEMLIGAVSIAIEKELGRSLGYRKVITSAPERYQGTDQPSLYLRRYPIREVEQVQIRPMSLTTPQDVTGWLEDPDLFAAGELRLPATLSVGFGIGLWPKSFRYAYSDLTGDPDPKSLEESIEVAYTGGYILPPFNDTQDADHNPEGVASDLPPNIEMACIDSVIFAATKVRHGLKAEMTAGGWRQDWYAGSGSPCLTPYTLDLLKGEYAWWFQ